MLARVQLRNLAIEALKNGKTIAEDRIYSPMDWPTVPAMYPVILVKTPRERKVSENRSIPKFNTTAELHLSLRVEANSEAEATRLIEQLCEQVENTLFTNYHLIQEIQQFSYVDTHVEVSAEGKKHSAEAVLLIGLEFYEVFDPQLLSPHAPIARPLEALDIRYQVDGQTIESTINLKD